MNVSPGTRQYTPRGSATLLGLWTNRCLSCLRQAGPRQNPTPSLPMDPRSGCSRQPTMAQAAPVSATCVSRRAPSPGRWPTAPWRRSGTSSKGAAASGAALPARGSIRSTSVPATPSSSRPAGAFSSAQGRAARCAFSVTRRPPGPAPARLSRSRPEAWASRPCRLRRRSVGTVGQTGMTARRRCVPPRRSEHTPFTRHLRRCDARV